jgi:D-psicose/D-tagatose/L-ribulose 3-epimerase
VKFGVTTYIWSAEFTAAEVPLLPRLRDRGFDGIEIPVFRPRDIDTTSIRRALEASGMACTAGAVLLPGYSLVSDDAAVRTRSIAHLRDIVHAVADLGATIVAGPVYTPVGELPGRRRTDDEWQRAIEAYQTLAPALEADGVTLAIEPLNRFETYFLNTMADGAALCDAVGHPRVGLLFDTFHANIEAKDVAGACRAAGRHVKYVHTSENDRGTPGSGHVDWPGVFRALDEIGYDGWLTIESFGFSLGDLSAAAAIWRDLAMTPEAIAWDGLAFLRRSLAGRRPSDATHV